MIFFYTHILLWVRSGKHVSNTDELDGTVYLQNGSRNSELEGGESLWGDVLVKLLYKDRAEMKSYECMQCVRPEMWATF